MRELSKADVVNIAADHAARIQHKVYAVGALIGCLKSVETSVAGPDLVSACRGIERLIDEVTSDLDSVSFGNALCEELASAEDAP